MDDAFNFRYVNPGKLSRDAKAAKCLVIAFASDTYAQACRSAIVRGYADSPVDYDEKVREAEGRGSRDL